MRLISVVSLAAILGCGDGSGTGPRRGDTVPPGVVLDLVAERSLDDRVTLRWTAPGDDGYAGQASHYDMRYDTTALTEARWEDATAVPRVPVPSPSGATDSTRIGGSTRNWYFALRSGDEEFNWSDLSNLAIVGRDTIAPGVVEDLRVFDFDETMVSLTWTAPGDDGFQGRAAVYDLRHSEAPITDAVWEEASAVEGTPIPSQPGIREFVAVGGLATGQRYYFALRTVDESGNRSGLSNLVDATATRDTIPPARVTDLEAIFAAGRTVNLRWTAPGSSGTKGRAAEYDLRYSLLPIDEATWEQATFVSGLPAPGLAGTTEGHIVRGLDLDTEYHFALRAVDEVMNWAEVSNNVTTFTASLIILTSNLRVPGISPPDWDPNGDQIAFANWGDQFQLYVIPTSGGDPRQLTSSTGGVSVPRWSPVGTRLACTVYRRVGLESHDALGIVEPRQGAVPTIISPHGANRSVSSSTWSPDGRRLAYQLTLTDSPSFEGQILVVDVTGGTPEQLFSDGSRLAGLDWSPDGTQIVFSSDRSGSYDLWVLPASGGEPTRLTSDPANETTPAWSPDGANIAFSSTFAGNADLWTMPSTGGQATQITFGPDGESSPSWSPNGIAICFMSSRSGVRDLGIVYLP